MICYLNLKWSFLLVIQWWNCICFLRFAAVFASAEVSNWDLGGCGTSLQLQRKSCDNMMPGLARDGPWWHQTDCDVLRVFSWQISCAWQIVKLLNHQTQWHRPPTTGDNSSVCRQQPRSFFLVFPAAGGRENTHGDRGTGHWPDFQISRCGRTLGRNGGRDTWRSWSLGMAGHEVHIPFRSQVGRAVGSARRLSFTNGIGTKKKDILWDLLMSLVDRTNIRRCSMPLMSKSTFQHSGRCWMTFFFCLPTD